MPMILELAGIDRDKGLIEGGSLVDLIEGRNLSLWRVRIAVSEEVTVMLRNQAYIVSVRRTHTGLFLSMWVITKPGWVRIGM